MARYRLGQNERFEQARFVIPDVDLQHLELLRILAAGRKRVVRHQQRTQPVESDVGR